MTMDEVERQQWDADEPAYALNPMAIARAFLGRLESEAAAWAGDVPGDTPGRMFH